MHQLKDQMKEHMYLHHKTVSLNLYFVNFSYVLE